MKVTVKLSEWYAKGNVSVVTYNASLENNFGQRCCLGFCALAHGKTDIQGALLPASVFKLGETSWMVRPTIAAGYLVDSDLASLAVALNDGNLLEDINWSEQLLPVRMGNLITVFAEGGDDLEFVP